MEETELVQIGIKAVGYLPFLVCGVLVVLCRMLVAERNLGAALLFGSAAGLGIVGWRLRYFLEQSAPEPTYRLEPTAEALVSIAAPTLAHDLVWAVATAVAFVAMVRAAPLVAAVGERADGVGGRPDTRAE